MKTNDKELRMKKGCSIIMPCLNEEKTVEVCIKKAIQFLHSYGIEGEVIVADNGSSDNSVLIAQKNGARVIRVSDKGYGSALRGGIRAARYEYIIMGDADDSYDFSALSGFILKLDQGFDLVMGNRRGGIEPGAMPFSHRYIGNPVLSGIGRRFFKTNVSDFHCGLRAFRKKAIEQLNLCTTGMEFASEMVVKAVLFNLKVTEIRCKLYPDGRNRKPHLRSIPDGLRHLEFLLIYSPKWLFAYPGLFLMILGILGMGTLYVYPLQIGRIQFGVTTMFYSAVIMLLGFQMVWFSVFTNLFGERIGQFPRSIGFVHKVEKILNCVGYRFSIMILSVGIAGIIFTFYKWSLVQFGHLNTTMVCKTAILFGSLFGVGFELLLFTIFTRVLQMGEKNNE